ncbi:NADPH:quinone oxidoreductase family protein [Caballeronia sp. LP006]|uniref:NADPH:quinone oxidoreductase family protein n=1 Tax=Caballeronia sp. LP006 TaxID=3038552 RepID=UPI002865E1A1|nr:NADPH:quinone oxidoreductase family protein [Caballeronia sp. LP006]MDR5826275.1 NADPH:quinone oxidoreductase family protein [Caballeronia sp. LP006]
MKAVVVREYGPPDQAKLEEIPAPLMARGSIRVKLEATCIGFANLLTMEGKHQNRAQCPFVPGTESAGVVLECAPDVTDFNPGDRVIAGMRDGAFAQEAVVPRTTVFHLPDDIDFVIGAQFPTIYATAYSAFKWRAHMQPGETLLVHGAAGGSGLAAVEVGKAMGARVIATASSEEKLAVIREHGADEVIDYQKENFRDRVLELTDGRGADVIYDPVGGKTFDDSLRCIAPDGRIIPMGFASGTIPQIPANIVLVKNITVIGLYWGYYVGWAKQLPLGGTDDKIRAAYQEMFEWVRQGKLKPLTYRTYPLNQFAEALNVLAAREAVGRVALLPHAE